MTTEQTCAWCERTTLVMRDGHLTCLYCRFYLVRKGDPGWEENFGSRIGSDHYWRLYEPVNELINISPALPR